MQLDQIRVWSTYVVLFDLSSSHRPKSRLDAPPDRMEKRAAGRARHDARAPPFLRTKMIEISMIKFE